MNVNHLISDTIVRIKNGFHRQKPSVSVLKSKTILSFIQVLEEEGFIRGYIEKEHQLLVFLKYHKGESVIINFKAISKPGKRVYFDSKDLMDWKNKTNSFEILILSTTQGILTDREVLKKGLGGEVLSIIN